MMSTSAKGEEGIRTEWEDGRGRSNEISGGKLYDHCCKSISDQ